jgi:oligogalacturonide lyase
MAVGIFRAVPRLIAICVLIAPVLCAQEPPKTWVDEDTGHRVFRLSDEPGSESAYFNVNQYSPDGKLMMYTAPDGIHVLDLATKKTHLLVANRTPPATSGSNPVSRSEFTAHAIMAGYKTPSVFFTELDPETHSNALYKADMYSGEVTKVTQLARGESIITINADETLAAGTMNDGAAVYNSAAPPGPLDEGAAGVTQRESKGQMMERRLASRQPLILYAIDLRPGPDNGKMKILLHSTDWINHLLFSPTDPELLMYCHEGPWQKVDRIWTIHTDGSHNTLIHKRTMVMEIAGHEFWGLDGKTIWYDWQYPKGEDFFLAGYNLETGQRTAYHMQRNEWSIHFNVTRHADLFTGDGGDPGQVAKATDGEWIELFRPQLLTQEGALNAPDFWQPGVLKAERLVNMAHHNYRLEPNVSFSPDNKMVIFRSNMFGPSYVFGVEVAKATDAAASEIHSTPALAAQFNPVNPTPTNVLPPAPSTSTAH